MLECFKGDLNSKAPGPGVRNLISLNLPPMLTFLGTIPADVLYDCGPGELILSSGVQKSSFLAEGITPCFIGDFMSVL